VVDAGLEIKSGLEAHGPRLYAERGRFTVRYAFSILFLLCAVALQQNTVQPIQGPYPTLPPGPTASGQQTMTPIQMPSPPAASGLPTTTAPSSSP